MRALRFRDRTVAELDRRLAEAGVGREEREGAIEALARAGYLDDRRVACARAGALAERGSGDALIRLDLERRGVRADDVDEAIAALEPEQERAARVVSRRGASVRTARYLLAKGFCEEVVDDAVARDTEGAVG